MERFPNRDSSQVETESLNPIRSIWLDPAAIVGFAVPASSYLSNPPFSRPFHAAARLALIKPFLLSDIGEGGVSMQVSLELGTDYNVIGITEVQIIQWFVEPGARVEQFDKLCEVQSDKAAVEVSRWNAVFLETRVLIDETQITSRFDGVIKKLHYEADDKAQVGKKPLCDIDVLSEISSKDEAVLGNTPEQAGSPSSPQQPQKAAEQLQGKQDQIAEPQDAPNPPPSGKNSSLATPAVRGLLKQYNIDISSVTGTGKDGRVLKEDVVQHASSQSNAASSSSSPSFSSTSPSTTGTEAEAETTIPLTPVQTQMFKTMTRSLQIPHFLYADEIDITALSRLRSRLNHTSSISTSTSPPLPKLSYLPFILKALSLALHTYPLLNARISLPSPSSPSPSTNHPRLHLRPSHNIGIAMDTPHGLLVPSIKNLQTLSIPAIALEIARLRSLASAGKLTAADLTGGTITVSNIGSIGGTYVSPIVASGNEVAILGLGRRRVVPAFASDEDGDGDGDGMRVVRKEVMCFSWAADHRVVDGATVARCAEVVRGLVERPEEMVVRMR
ncbi:MAG: hypothetical protein Q9184_002648 [Pyrenodesmia sp. 2 TL-2023]